MSYGCYVPRRERSILSESVSDDGVYCIGVSIPQLLPDSLLEILHPGRLDFVTHTRADIADDSYKSAIS